VNYAMSEAHTYPGYATPTFVARGGIWVVAADPWGVPLGAVWESFAGGWTVGT